jgi:hypothetical protein
MAPWGESLPSGEDSMLAPPSNEKSEFFTPCGEWRGELVFISGRQLHPRKSTSTLKVNFPQGPTAPPESNFSPGVQTFPVGGGELML